MEKSGVAAAILPIRRLANEGVEREAFRPDIRPRGFLLGELSIGVGCVVCFLLGCE